MDWDNDRRHIKLHAPPGGKTSISIFGTEEPTSYSSYSKPKATYAAPEPTYGSKYYAAPTAYEPPKPSYSSKYTENTNPFETSSGSSYKPPMPAYSEKPSSYPASVTTFGAKTSMRSEHNLGGDGNEKTSVKVHHPPGGGGSLNLFGGPSEPTYAPPKYKPKASYEPTGYYEAPAAGSYKKSTYADSEPLTDFNYKYEDSKDTAAYYEPPAPVGFKSSTKYSSYTPIEPTSLSVSSTTQTFGKRVESGMNSGPTTDKSSIRVHAPPGGKSSIFF